MRTIGVITSFVAGAHFGEVMTQLVLQAPRLHIRLLVFRMGSRAVHYDGLLGSAVCDGWLLLADCIDVRQVEQWVSSGKPVCTLSWTLPVAGVSFVRSDNRSGVCQALDLLTAEGHRNFAFVGNTTVDDIRERRDAFLQYLTDHRLPDETNRVLDSSDDSTADGWSAAERLRKSGVDFTALLTGNDQTAIGAMHHFRHAGLAVPADVAIVGYDNSLKAADPEIQLTSLDQDMEQIVHTALLDLTRRLETPSADGLKLRVSPHLVIRGSTDPSVPPVELVPAQDEISRLGALYEVESNRYLYAGDLGPLGYLQKFTLFGRQALYSLVDRQSAVCQFCSVPSAAEMGKSEPLFEFGRGLLDHVQRLGDLVILVPLVFDQRLGAALAVSFPPEQVNQKFALALAVRDMEQLAFSIERSTEQARLEQQVEQRTAELRAAQKELLQAARVEVMRPILTGIAHHLNTPLGTGLMTVSAMKDRLASRGGDSDLVPMVDLIQGALHRAADLVTNFRAVAEYQIHSVRAPFSPHTLVETAIVLFRSQHPGRALEVRSQISPSLRIDGMANALAGALAALLENAVKHGQPSGAGAIEVDARCDGSFLLITVRDHGPGCSEADAERVFEPFFTTRLADCSGLGLTLVHNVITTLFHGTVRIATAPGQGFAVVCRFPVVT